MKLRNPVIYYELRKFYFKNGWKHKEVQKYLSDHYSLSVCIRTLKRWKKKLKDFDWKHPKIPRPPVPGKILKGQKLKRITDFRKKTGYGSLIIKHVFKLDCSESTIKRMIKLSGLS